MVPELFCKNVQVGMAFCKNVQVGIVQVGNGCTE